MAEQFNINNLTLDDNSFKLLPDGDYRFTVKSHELEYSTSEKMPPNTQVVTCILEIPYYEDGLVQFATVRNKLNIYSKGMFAVRQFTDCIGLTPEKGKVAGINLETMDGIVYRKRLAAGNKDMAELHMNAENVKTFYKEKDHIRLQPENSTMEPIIVKEVAILGKVAGVIRKL